MGCKRVSECWICALCLCAFWHQPVEAAVAANRQQHKKSLPTHIADPSRLGLRLDVAPQQRHEPRAEVHRAVWTAYGEDRPLCAQPYTSKDGVRRRRRTQQTPLLLTWTTERKRAQTDASSNLDTSWTACWLAQPRKPLRAQPPSASTTRTTHTDTYKHNTH
jgi:hypothetical protein